MTLYIYIDIYSKKVFVKDSMVKLQKKCRYYLFCFLDHQINYFEVQINSDKNFGPLFALIFGK